MLQLQLLSTVVKTTELDVEQENNVLIFMCMHSHINYVAACVVASLLATSLLYVSCIRCTCTYVRGCLAEPLTCVLLLLLAAQL